mmetsp:Transcript_84986/g.241044  ORF Transcript_84986/g.241044 Transcript_84986/m.241044 type:complete len:204 (+) Transcript_84986:2498-3109(+)
MSGGVRGSRFSTEGLSLGARSVRAIRALLVSCQFGDASGFPPTMALPANGAYVRFHVVLLGCPSKRRIQYVSRAAGRQHLKDRCSPCSSQGERNSCGVVTVMQSVAVPALVPAGGRYLHCAFFGWKCLSLLLLFSGFSPLSGAMTVRTNRALLVLCNGRWEISGFPDALFPPTTGTACFSGALGACESGARLAAAIGSAIRAK